MTRNRIVIALGANLPRGKDKPEHTLLRATRRLAGHGIRVVVVSPLFRNPADPPGSGPDFVNAVVLAETAHGPAATLSALQRVERALGRRMLERAGPRTLDLDLIDHGGIVRPDPALWRRHAAREVRSRAARPPLALPHPAAHRRPFVMRPLLAVSPRWRHAVFCRSAGSLLEAYCSARKSGWERLP